MGNKLYVGNLNYSVKAAELTALFAEYGQVVSVNIIEGRGFGFVEMSSDAEAAQAREALHDTDFKGRPLKIDEARPRQDRPKNRSGGGGRGDQRRGPRPDNRRRDQPRGDRDSRSRRF